MIEILAEYGYMDVCKYVYVRTSAGIYMHTRIHAYTHTGMQRMQKGWKLGRGTQLSIHLACQKAHLRIE